MSALDPLALLSGLILETGHTWAGVAADWQREDAAAILDAEPTAPRRHYALRAGVSLALLLTQAPNGHARMPTPWTRGRRASCSTRSAAWCTGAGSVARWRCRPAR